ncbi:MAG: ABC transporter substrate-binding protein [Polaromonas sp.]|uniref:ABC transporter substrate-binding protein n=1 Tax=Polaromonas sp. TaxID=1869339 RepID=UPI0025CBADB7|nr:ABC transporter substrate-binding protein [Polaromonas sp.]MBI2727900.1 ABC transporter substrate-binding protein [Polaromonas sp.]
MSTNNPSKTSRPDALWYTRCPVPTASGIAIHQGWIDQEFAKDGIVVSSLRSSPDRAVRESHFDHRQANSFRQGGNAPPIWSRSEGQDVVVVGLTWLPQYQSILTLPGSGIKTAKDLKGKRLALPRRMNDKIDFWRASALQGYLQVLAAVGLGEKDVNFVDLAVERTYIGQQKASHAGPLFDARQSAQAASAEAFALIRGEVDAIYTYGAAGPALETFLGAHVVVDINHHPDQEVAINNGTPNVLTVSGELARKHPDIVARYLSQVLRAAYWARENREEAGAIIAEEVSVVKEWLPDAFDESLYDNLLPSLDAKLVHALEVRKDFMFKHGFIKNDFSIAEWIDPKPLAAAREILKSQANKPDIRLAA